MPLNRVKIQNTYARALIATGREGWELPLETSLSIQREIFPHDVPRTENYLLLGLIRSGRLAEAGSRIGVPQDWRQFQPMSLWRRAFLRADLARCLGQQWQVEDMDSCEEPPSGCARPLAFYLQSTARQNGRNLDDRVARFDRANTLLTIDIKTAQNKPIESLMRGWLNLLKTTIIGDQLLFQPCIEALKNEIRGTRISTVADNSSKWLSQIEQGPTEEAVGKIVDQLLVL